MSYDFTWAENYPEVHKICTLFNLDELRNPIEHSYRPLESYIQDGPQCGLVALSMLIGNPSRTIDSLLDMAKSLKYTNHGEMFSVQNMVDLATKHQLSAELYSGYLNTDFITGFLLKGGCLLVPYDSDKDNSPCLLNGHRAHWAVICGAVKTACGFFVIARHGKAKNIAFWSLSSLAESNAQLNQVGTYSKNPEIEFILPIGGINGKYGLNLKSVLVHPIDMEQLNN